MKSKVNEKAGRLGALAVIALLAGVVTGVWVVCDRLDDQALAVLAGSICGVAAAIPTSLLILAVQRRQTEERRPQPQQTPMVVMPPQMIQPQMLQPGYSPGVYDFPPLTRGGRYGDLSFDVVGEDLES